ncbi:17447_t:CDS:2, partial [Funneliformis caledonium]
LNSFVDYFCPGIVATSPVQLVLVFKASLHFQQQVDSCHVYKHYAVSISIIYQYIISGMENLTVRIVWSVRKSNRSGSIIEPVENLI